MEVATSYVGLGIQHILLGLDHLALLLCLSMLARGMVLLRLVTAFTVGHSITLCAAALDWINVPIPPVEVLIVLSVAYLAREVWFAHRLDRSSTVLLVGIGLLHGLGFASVLSEIGLPMSDLLVALVSFNVGVEIGQVIFLGAAIGVQTALARLTVPSLRPVAQSAIALILGITAMYWTLERIAGFYA